LIDICCEFHQDLDFTADVAVHWLIAGLRIFHLHHVAVLQRNVRASEAVAVELREHRLPRDCIVGSQQRDQGVDVGVDVLDISDDFLLVAVTGLVVGHITLEERK